MSNSRLPTFRIAADQLRLAIRRNGWTYARAATEVRKHLSQDTKFSAVSIWSYATGRSSPRRIRYIEAIEAAFAVPPGGLGGPGTDGQGEDSSDHSPSAPADERRSPSHPADGSAASPDQFPPCPITAPAALPGSTFFLADTSDGNVRMRIETVVPWHMALKIFDIIKPREASEEGSENDLDNDASSASPATEADSREALLRSRFAGTG